MGNCNNLMKVCIRCSTFNQSRYIEDAMNGFVMQKTDFPFIAAIVDDASTDGEPQVLRDYYYRFFNHNDSKVAYEIMTEYGTILFAQHLVNKNCYFAIVLLKENHYSQKKSKLPYFSRWSDSVEYIALCEGDDYWTDASKLQKQVAFLDDHEEYSLCCHRYKIYNQDFCTWDDDYVKALFDSKPEGFSFSRADNLKTWITKTMTVVYRRDRLDQNALLKYRFACDEHQNYLLLSNGDGYCFPFVGAVYRRTGTGVYAHLSELQKMKRGVLIRSELLNHNREDKELRDDVCSRIRKYLFEYHSFSGIVPSVKICLMAFFGAEGLKASLRFSRKVVGAWVNGLRNKWFDE